MERILTEDEVLNAKWNAIITGQPIHEELDDIDAEYLTESDDEKHMNRKIIAGATGVAIVGLASLYSGIKGLIKQHREAKTAEKKAIIAQHIAKMRAQIAKKKAAAHKK